MNNTALSSPAESVWSMPTASQGSMFNRLDPKNMFNRLPDEIVVHICCYLDCYSLLKFGRSSFRMYNIVCSPRVWIRLLRGIEDFSDAKVRMLMFFAKRGDFLCMMTEVLREIVLRHPFSEGRDIVRVKVRIGGWCDAKTYDMDTDAMGRLFMVEKESGARMLLTEVKEFKGSRNSPRMRDSNSFFNRKLTFGRIGDHMNIQQGDIDRLELSEFTGSWELLHILRKSNSWLIKEFYFADWFTHQLSLDQMQRHWVYLAESADEGEIKMLLMDAWRVGMWPALQVVLEHVRKVWEITHKVTVRKPEDRSTVELRAGRSDGNLDEKWQQFTNALQY